jgi:SAM-dependent methyltransferase
MGLDDSDFVREQYRSTERLTTRVSVWHPDQDGRWPQDVALAALTESAPSRLLEVGCGTGEFAARCAEQLGCEVIALDLSPEMVAATRARGLPAETGDVQSLPFPDGSFDCAVAAWMLYHVPDVELAVVELRRVLRPGGRLVAITNGVDHLRELWDAVSGERLVSTFSGENGAAILERHFHRVERVDVATRAVFPSREDAARYLASLDRADLADRLPEFGLPLIARGAPTVFVADT